MSDDTKKQINQSVPIVLSVSEDDKNRLNGKHELGKNKKEISKN